MSESIDPRLLEVFETFDSFCRQNGVRYRVENNAYYRQGYAIGLGDPALVESHMREAINDKWIEMEVEKHDSGALFVFGVKHLSEDQYKFSTRKMIRKQSAFRSSIGPSRSFGGISGYKKLHKKLAEAFKLKDDLVAHDNVTKIPAGTDVDIHDPDPRLPDVDWDGTTSNVDMDKLVKAVSDKELSKIVKESVLLEQPSSIGAFLTSKIHEGFTVAADRAFAAGYLTQEERIAMSDAITDALKTFTAVMKKKYPKIYRREVDGAEAISMSKGSLGERIEKRISEL
jgi:hypothetical protein